ncbi:MAG TPA: phage tail protein [Herpetosiphonaceae bacterium]
MSNTRKVYSAHRFKVEMNGIIQGSFSECSGLQVETEIFEWQEGGRNEYTHRLPGRVKFSNITLKRGIATMDMWNWFNRTRWGKIERADISIVLMDMELRQIQWNITGALPIKWLGPSFKANTGEAAVESIELIHNGFEQQFGK